MNKDVHSAYYAAARYPSVCPSVTRRYTIETSKHIIKLFSPSGSHTIRFFSTGTPLTKASNAGMHEKNRDFRPISRFISKMIQDGAIVAM